MERSALRELRYKPSIVRYLRVSDPTEPPIYQSVSRINRRVDFDDFRTKSITFGKQFSSMKSLRHILSFQKSGRLRDFKEFFKTQGP